ncbi:MAG: hypothetical protein EZS28_017881 [Streblomastix strix]|uniref:Uncharacterized protein n=1 Tax=Streblomastix strix TaxID=222440 RepID=A0A5J4VVV3_9EUKA|nr:MAG: hypothetical protein EZS28_017881 [Streblomastix strix]
MSSSRNMQSTFISDPSNDLIEQAIQQPGVVQVVRRHHSRKRHHTRRSTSPQFSPNDINEENDRNFEGNIEEYSPDGPNLIPPSFSRRGASFSQSVHPSLTQQNIEQFDQPISNHFLSQSMRDLKNVRNSPHSNAQNNNQSQFQDISYENRQGPLVERLSSPNRGSHVSRQLVRARDISSPNDPIYEKTLYHSKSRRRYKSTKRTFSPTGNDEYIPGHIEPIQQSDVELQYHIDGEQDDADDFLQPDQHKLYNQQQTREFHSQLDPQIINQMNKPQLSPQIRSPSPTIPSIKKGNLFINDGIPDQRNPVYTDINMSNIIDPYNNADNNGISQQEQYHRDQHIERQIKNYRQRIDDLEEEQDQQQNEYDRIQQQEYEQEQEQLKRQRQMQIKRQMDKQKQNSIQLDREYVRQRERAIQRQRQLEQQQLEQENLLLGQQQQQQIQEFDQIIEEEVEEEEQNERRDYIRRNGFNGTEEEEEEYVQGERKTRSFQSPSNINTRSSIFSLNQPQINQKQQIQQYNRERERQIEQEQERIEQEIEQKERIEREMQQQEDERQLQLQKEKYRLELQKKQLEAEKQHQLQLQKEKLEQDRIDIQVRERELIEKEKEQERQQKQKEQERKEKERQKEQIKKEREEKKKELEQEQKKMNEKYEQERLLEQRRRQSPIRTSPTRLVYNKDINQRKRLQLNGKKMEEGKQQEKKLVKKNKEMVRLKD